MKSLNKKYYVALIKRRLKNGFPTWHEQLVFELSLTKMNLKQLKAIASICMVLDIHAKDL